MLASLFGHPIQGPGSEVAPQPVGGGLATKGATGSEPPLEAGHLRPPQEGLKGIVPGRLRESAKLNGLKGPRDSEGTTTNR